METVSHNNNAEFRANFSIDRPTFCHGQIPLDSERRWVDFFSSRLSHRDGDLIHYGSLVDRFGARRPGSLAFAVTGVALFSLRFILHNNIPEKVLMGGLLAIVGLGITVVQIIAMTEVSQVVIDYEAQSPGILGGKPPMAQAYALFNMAYASGQMLGPVVAGSLQIRTGWSGMTLFFGIASALCALHMGL